MRTYFQSLIVLFLIALFLASCNGTLEVRLDQTPTPDRGGAATITALQNQNDQLATAVATLDPISQPLTLDSTPAQIVQKMMRSSTLWQTLYVEGYIFNGGSEEPSAIWIRSQSWIDLMTAQGRTLGGDDASPQWMMLADGASIKKYDLKTAQIENYNDVNPQMIIDFANLARNDDAIRFHPMSAILGSPLSDLIFPVSLAQRSGIMQIVEMGETGILRPALIVDYYHALGQPRAERMWVDAETGILLRMEEYGKGGDGQTLQSVYVISKLDVNPALDSAMFISPPQTLPTSYEGGKASPPATPNANDPLGEVYFFDSDYAYPVPNVRLVRLPGSCVAGKVQCPESEVVPAPVAFNFSTSPFVWSPDRKLAAFSYPIREDGNYAGLFVFNSEELSWKQIADFNFIDLPMWSADGSWIAFRVQDGNGGEELYAVHPDGSDLQSLTAKLPAEGAPYVMNGWIGFNLLVNTGRPGQESTYYSLRVPDGKVTPLFEGLVIKSIFTPSPDGSLLAYIEYDYNSPRQTLKVLTPNGDTQRELASFNNVNAIYPLVWSPDGNYIAFPVMDSDANISELYVIRRDGRDLQQVYRGQMILNPSFSPDGKYLIFEDQDHIYTVSLGTYESRILSAPNLKLTNRWMNVSWR